jgi:hypothetical protein
MKVGMDFPLRDLKTRLKKQNPITRNGSFVLICFIYNTVVKIRNQRGAVR